MAAHMWRMNGLWRRMAGVLLLSALLLSSEVMCQDDASAATTVPPSDAAADASAPSVAPGAPATTESVTGAAGAAGAVSAASSAPAAPGDSFDLATIVNVVISSHGGDPVAVASDAPVVLEETTVIKTVVPVVKCVGKEDIPESAIKVSVQTSDCEETKSILQANPAGWCNKEDCKLQIAQDGNTIKVASEDAKLSTLAAAVQSSALKDKLGVSKVETPSSSGSSVFVGILVSGLLAAAGIVLGYFKRPCKGDPKGVKLAEEAYPVDQENQGNTLVSVAPLNPPPETPEKPNVNGESPEAPKTEPAPPPTNGTSTTKTADTEL